MDRSGLGRYVSGLIVWNVYCASSRARFTSRLFDGAAANCERLAEAVEARWMISDRAVVSAAVEPIRVILWAVKVARGWLFGSEKGGFRRPILGVM